MNNLKDILAKIEQGSSWVSYDKISGTGPDKVAIKVEPGWMGRLPRETYVAVEKGKVTKLAAAPFVRQPGREYALRAEAKGKVLTLFVNGTPVLEASDSRYAYGMPGLGLTAAGETLWRAPHISGEC